MSDLQSVPNHVAIIMDGNGRWAERRGLPRVEGHRKGAERVSDIMRAAKSAGVKYLTLYAFSTENWKRSPAEVAALMNLLSDFLDEKLPELQRENVRLNAIGRLDKLPAYKKLLKVMELTSGNTSGVLNLALNYGGRAEITDAVNKIIASGKRNISEDDFHRYLYSPDIPDPDLLIRTSGEMRISNFLLWELSYSEIYVTDVLWPDFDAAEFQAALSDYSGRDRRFGGRK